jgi:hypothetical protein
LIAARPVLPTCAGPPWWLCGAEAHSLPDGREATKPNAGTDLARGGVRGAVVHQCGVTRNVLFDSVYF